MLSRSESMNYVTSCHQVESVVIKAPIGKVWETLRTFNFDKFLPSSFKSVKFNSGSPNEVGSIFEVEYKEGSVWTFRLVEISETKRVLSWELISAEPQITFSSLLTTVRLYQVTEDNSTFISWESDYSNDVNSHVLQDGKFKKLEYFKDLKNVFQSN